MYGTQTVEMQKCLDIQFENDVKMYGTQTLAVMQLCSPWFENDVKMYGTQTMKRCAMRNFCLRMM